MWHVFCCGHGFSFRGAICEFSRWKSSKLQGSWTKASRYTNILINVVYENAYRIIEYIQLTAYVYSIYTQLHVSIYKCIYIYVHNTHIYIQIWDICYCIIKWKVAASNNEAPNSKNLLCSDSYMPRGDLVSGCYGSMSCFTQLGWWISQFISGEPRWSLLSSPFRISFFFGTPI